MNRTHLVSLVMVIGIGIAAALGPAVGIFVHRGG